MKYIKVKGIVLKEVAFSDYDKIITILTDEIGVITCMAKGARRSKSHILSSSQFLVYSEFLLYKGSKFYHINSANAINTFYNLRIDFDKLTESFEISKIVISLTDENIESKDILKLFLNTIYLLEKDSKNILFLKSIFIIKFLNILGFGVDMYKCQKCNKEILKTNKFVYYDFLNNCFLCDNCKNIKTIKMDYIVYYYITYIMNKDINSVLSLKIEDKYVDTLHSFGQAFYKFILKNN